MMNGEDYINLMENFYYNSKLNGSNNQEKSYLLYNYIMIQVQCIFSNYRIKSKFNKK